VEVAPSVLILTLVSVIPGVRQWPKAKGREPGIQRGDHWFPDSPAPSAAPRKWRRSDEPL